MISRKSSHTMENAKKGATYGGFFGLGIGAVTGISNAQLYGMLGHNTRGMVPIHCAAGVVVCASAGALVGAGIGLFSARNNQQDCPTNIISNNTSLKK